MRARACLGSVSPIVASMGVAVCEHNVYVLFFVGVHLCLLDIVRTVQFLTSSYCTIII